MWVVFPNATLYRCTFLNDARAAQQGKKGMPMAALDWRSAARPIALALLLAVSVSACGGGGAGSGAVNPPAPSATAPAVTQQPAPVSVIDGGSASFSVSASGTGPLSYQWQRNGQEIAGATAPALTVDHLAVTDTGTKYRVVISNAAGSVTSADAVLTVTATPVVIVLQPAALANQEGATASLQVNATGSGPLRYQWFRAGHPIDGATAAALTVGPLRYGDDVDYTVQVSNDASTALSSAAAVRISPATAPRPLSGCSEITAPGSYLVTSDILPTPRTTTCVSVHDTHDVQIDCANHKLAGTATSDAIHIERVDHFSLRNCTIDAGWFSLSKVSWGSITNNSLGSSWPAWPEIAVSAWNADHIVFAHNSILGEYVATYADNSTMSNNRINGSPQQSGSGGILSAYSRHVRIVGNTIDGGWSGPFPNPVPGQLLNRMGLDDGIILTDVSDAILENNTIRNVWDTGIEWLGSLSDSTIRGNYIENTGFSGIGGWYWASASNVQFIKNTFSNVSQMFQIFRYYGLRAAGSDDQKSLPADTEVRFRDNVFDGNVLLATSNNGASGVMQLFNKLGYTGSVSSLPGERVIPDNAFNIGNNVFRNNDFGAGVVGPGFGEGVVVPGVVVDGGGNKCLNNWPASYPIKCI
jgi:parallel beta-helix repeat protein